ncbi:MAG: hypothetical protein C4294_17080 [Nitrospiraceae bacterium]
MRNLFIGNTLFNFSCGILIASSGTFAKAESSLDSGPSYRNIEAGVIFTASASAKSGACDVNSCWTPSVQDIVRLESSPVPSFASSTVYRADKIRSSIDQYKRKYFGAIRKGKKLISVSGLCKKYWRPESKKFLKTDRPMTDMGRCQFSLDYDVKARKFSDLYIHGEG